MNSLSVKKQHIMISCVSSSSHSFILAQLDLQNTHGGIPSQHLDNGAKILFRHYCILRPEFSIAVLHVPVYLELLDLLGRTVFGLVLGHEFGAVWALSDERGDLFV